MGMSPIKSIGRVVDMTEVTYHFAPMEIYTLFAIGVACYAISVSRSVSRYSSFVR